MVWEKHMSKWTTAVSGLLLRGWKMLNESCPVTHAVPLMQNREGQKFSPALDDFVDGLGAAQFEEKARGIVKACVRAQRTGAAACCIRGHPRACAFGPP
jgi:uncharacterized Zn finger protein (UPF0148 family)